VANSSFVDVSYLIQWQAPEILLLYALVLEVLPVTQSDALKENILIGHLKQSYFSAIAAVQAIYTKQRCPYKISAQHKKTYVSSPLVQLMRLHAIQELGLRMWRTNPAALAAQMVMAIRASNINTIRYRSEWMGMEMAQGLVDIGRLLKAVERKYEALFSPAMKGVWIEAADQVKTDAQTIRIGANEPNLWVAAIWYMENSQRFHNLMQQIAPGRHSQVKLKAPKGRLLEFAERPALTEKQMSLFVDEFKHSLFAAYATYGRAFLLADTFYEKARGMMHQPLQIPPPRVTKPIGDIEIYAYVSWTMPDEINYIRGASDPQYIKDGLQGADETMIIE